MRTRRLPPLGHLRLFEAAGRHLSFKQAAEELVVTPSAVSHGIQALEDWLGVPLFVRTNRGLTLTAAGLSYMPYVSRALSTLAVGLEALPDLPDRKRMQMSVAPAFASRWLLPRLGDFLGRHAGIEVQLDTSARYVDLPLDGHDIAIRRGTGEWYGLQAIELIRYTLVPCCAPRLLEGRPFSTEELKRLPVILTKAWQAEWGAWLRESGLWDAGLSGLSLARGLQVDTTDIAIEAAIAGLGVVMSPGFLIAADLEAGRLTRIEAPPVVASGRYWLVGARESMGRPEIAAFRRWLREAIATERRPGTGRPG